MDVVAATDNRSRPHVLVVDHDAEIAGVVDRYLSAYGCRVSTAVNGAQILAALAGSLIDLVVADLDVPDEGGLLLRHLQGHWRGPVIVVSGRGEPVGRVGGLGLGADSYLSKPFELRELLARIRSVLRRTRTQPGPATPTPSGGFRFDGLRLDPASRRLTDRDGREVALTTGEFELLQALLERPNQVLTREALMNCMHGRDVGPFDRAIDVRIGRLRRKIELDATHPRVIQSVRGAGYVLAGPVEHP